MGVWRMPVEKSTKASAATEQAQRSLEERRVRQGDLRGRIEVLEGLERAQEGLGAGVRELLGRLNARVSDSASPNGDDTDG